MSESGFETLEYVKQSRGGIRRAKSSLLGVEILVQVDGFHRRQPARLLDLLVEGAILLVISHSASRMSADSQMPNAKTEGWKSDGGLTDLQLA
jgi:hypothetical protein